MKYLRINPIEKLRAANIDIESDKKDLPENKVVGTKRSSDDNETNPGPEICDKKRKLHSSNAGPSSWTGAESEQGSDKSQDNLSSVQVLGHELLYKQHAASVLFMKSSIMTLLTAKMPLDESQTPPLESVIKSSRAEEGKVAFISWSKVKAVLHGGLLDLSVREALLKEASPDNSRDNDNIMLGSEKVKYKVKNGVVYFEVLSAFASIGRLHEALSGLQLPENQTYAKSFEQT